MMTRADLVAEIGPADELIIQEALRTGASRRDFRQALALAHARVPAGTLAYDGLPARQKRLVDLLTVALDRPAAGAARVDRQGHSHAA